MTCISPPHLRAFFHLLHLTLQQPTLFHSTARTIHDQRTMEDNDTTAALSLEATTPHPDHCPPARPPTHPSTHRLRNAFFRASALLHAAYSTWRTQHLRPTPDRPPPHPIHAAPRPRPRPRSPRRALRPLRARALPLPRRALLATCICEDAAVVMADMIERVVGRASSPPLPPEKKKKTNADETHSAGDQHPRARPPRPRPLSLSPSPSPSGWPSTSSQAARPSRPRWTWRARSTAGTTGRRRCRGRGTRRSGWAGCTSACGAAGCGSWTMRMWRRHGRVGPWRRVEGGGG